MKVSVVTACHNSDTELLARAINSVLGQTYQDFDYIIVDDGSSYSIEPIVRSISDDKRIQVFKIQKSGLGAALNFGIKQSTADYIARIDDDDIMCPDRLLKQVYYLDTHPEVVCLGTQHYDMFNSRYRKHKHYPEKHEDMIKAMLTNIRLSMAHTTLMFRRDAFDRIGGYRIPGGGQDADLILQMSRVGKLANLSDYLTYYTMSASGLGTVNPNKRKAYLFAFEEILRQNVYPQYKEQIEHSIDVLKNQVAAGHRSVLKSIIIRKLLISRILLLGRSFKHIDN